MYTVQQARPNSVQKMHQEDFGQQDPAFSWGPSTLRLQTLCRAGGTCPPTPQLTMAEGLFPAQKQEGRLGEKLQNREKKELLCVQNSSSSRAGALLK